MLDSGMTDGMQQVRLAQPHTAIEKERVIRLARRLRDRLRCRVRKLIAAADDERGERVAGMEAWRHQLIVMVETIARELLAIGLSAIVIIARILVSVHSR